jgi:glucose-6-phosphate 1-dehydrogenase
MDKKANPATIVIFGASGDLTQRKLVPALHSLACEGLLPEGIRILGTARTEFSEESFREHLYSGIEDYARHKPKVCQLWGDWSEQYSYLQGEYDDPETYRHLAHHLEEIDRADGTQGNRLFYLAVPPMLYARIVEGLGQVGLNQNGDGWVRIVVEKPFGHDLASAHDLNERIHAVFEEDQVLRIDHYLGKETVQNILTLRFANAIFEPLWNRRYVSHVQISVAESVEVGQRAGYYDDAGVLRDMFQNHLLQLLTLTAMEPPVALNEHALRDEKVKVLHAVRPPEWEDLVLGQYRGYQEYEKVDASSTTPTFAALRLFIDNWRWQGVPFYLRSGKNLQEKMTEIALQFRPVPHLLFPESASLAPNRLAICIQPDEGIHLSFEAKEPGAGMRPTPANLEFSYAENFGEGVLPEAYERLLLDALQGDASLFTRGDEIELAWKLLDPLLDRGEPFIYEPGSWGPEEAEGLIRGEGCSWHLGCLHRPGDDAS